MISSEKKQKVIASMQGHKNDSGSSAVQVGIMTERISELTEHLKTNQKDHAARRGLLQLVGKRKKLLRYISEQDTNLYLKIVEKLGLRK
jgi:small subunit ribosomal protein S15